VTPRFEKTESVNLPVYRVSDTYANVYRTGATTGVALLDWKQLKGTFLRLTEGDLLQTVSEGEAVFVIGATREDAMTSRGYAKQPD
jgi:hypothetical protein